MLRTRRLILSRAALTLGLSVAPCVSAAQEPKVPRIGVLLLGGPGPRYDELRKDLANLGHIEGRNVTFEPRFARGQFDRVPALAAELVALNVDVIVAVGAIGVEAAQKATAKIPIVFAAVLDPVSLGYAATLERPGRNITGIMSFDPKQAGAQFETLREVIPNLARVAILSDQDVPRTDGWNPLERLNDAAARATGLRPQWVRVKAPTPDLDAAFAAMLGEQAEALLVLEVPVTLLNLKPIADLAAKHRMPSMFPGGWPNDGLITFGTSINDAVPRIAGYVDRILKGAQPGSMPIEAALRRELIVNLKTARNIGITISPELLKRADRVIQ